MFGKSSFLDLEPLTMIHADSVSLLTSTDDQIWLSLDKFIAEFAIIYIYI